LEIRFKTKLYDITGELIATLQKMKSDGCRGFECPQDTLEILEKWGVSPGCTPDSLERIRQDLGDCRRCPLYGTRKQIVFGTGNPKARLVFVGEAPGYDEDRQGLPFVGAAGQLLTKIIHAMNLSREQVYICNIVKCRPPNNRDPQPDEIRSCLPYLHRQLAVIQPEVICALGKFAAQTLVGSQEPISKLRGRFYAYRGIPLMPTYHPAYLLRNPQGKRHVWEDIQEIMKTLNT
jgi:DNA polymerase